MSVLPKYPEYTYPVLSIIRGMGGSATIDEIEDKVAEFMGLNEDQLSVPHGETGRTEYQYKLAWVRTYLKKYGALENSERGVWSITDIGERITPDEALEIFRKVQATRPRKSKPNYTDPVDGDPIDDGDAVSWIDKLLTVIGAMSPDGFERLAQRLLRESGFIKVEVTGRSADQGIDGIGVLRMNLVSFHVLFQCKRWKGSVGSSVVRDFRGAMVGRADKGLIITTGTFTADARKEATRDGAPAIDLIDGETLCGLLRERRLGVGIEMVEKITVDEGYFSSI